MTRRPSVVLLLAGLVLASGCLGTASLGPGPDTAPVPDPDDEGGPEPDVDENDTATQFTRPNASDPVPLPLPDVPATLSAETAGEFAAAYEEVRMHNELLSDVEDTITELGTSCEAVSVEADGEAYRATVECGHWYEFESGSAVGIADGAPYRTTYLVDDEAIEQTGDREYVY